VKDSLSLDVSELLRPSAMNAYRKGSKHIVRESLQTPSQPIKLNAEHVPSVKKSCC